MTTLKRLEQFSKAGVLALLLATATHAQVNTSPNWGMPSSQQMMQTADPTLVREYMQWSAQVEANPRNVAALTNRGIVSMTIARKSPLGVFWLHAAAKDLERAIQLAPSDFYAHHNYAEVCFRYGDAPNDHSAQLIAIREYTKAIEIKPDSARSYMGRSWAYLMLNDEAHAAADARRALQIDPGLQGDLENESNAIRERNRESLCAQQMVRRMGAYVVDRNARTSQQCAAAKGYWTGGECRISTALAPGPLMLGGQDAATGNAGLGGPSCTQRDAANHRYNGRAGGYFVK